MARVMVSVAFARSVVWAVISQALSAPALMVTVAEPSELVLMVASLLLEQVHLMLLAFWGISLPFRVRARGSRVKVSLSPPSSAASNRTSSTLSPSYRMSREAACMGMTFTVRVTSLPSGSPMMAAVILAVPGIIPVMMPSLSTVTTSSSEHRNSSQEGSIGLLPDTVICTLSSCCRP